MLKEARVLLPARAVPRVEHRNELIQRVIRHLAHAGDLGILRAQAEDELLRALVHVAVGAVHMAAHDVEEIGVDPEALDHVRDPALDPRSPRVFAHVHVGEPAVLVTVVVPIDPVEVVEVAVDLVGGAALDLVPHRLLAVRGVRAEHRHHPEAQFLRLGDETPKARFPAHARGDFVVRIIPVVAAIPRREEGEDAVGGHPGGDPAEDLELLRVVVEDEAGVVHPVQGRDHGEVTHPGRRVGPGLPGRDAECPFDLRHVRLHRGFQGRGVAEAPARDHDAFVFLPRAVLVDGFHAVGLLAGLEVVALRSHPIVVGREIEEVVLGRLHDGDGCGHADRGLCAVEIARAERVAREDIAVLGIVERAASHGDRASGHVANDGGDALDGTIHLGHDVPLDGGPGLHELRGELARRLLLAARPDEAVRFEGERVRVARRLHPRTVEAVGVLFREDEEAETVIPEGHRGLGKVEAELHERAPPRRDEDLARGEEPGDFPHRPRHR